MQKKLISVLAASVLAVSAAAPAYAVQPKPVPFVHHHHFGTGAWVVGNIALSAASLIGCAAIVSKKYNRQLTQQEAFGAAALPFSCLFTLR